MTLYVNNNTELIASNNIDIVGDQFNFLQFILTSQYSKTDEVFSAQVVLKNDRYTKLVVSFPEDFKNEHKNGVYYYTIQNTIDEVITVFEKGLCKLITEPGGSNGSISYDSGEITENRKSDVYFRPNY